jgi:SPOR domain
MDQNTTGGTDKRNWRERLGIGTKEAAMTDMPRVSDEFKPAAPVARPASTVKPAPMAPRVAVRAAPAARPATQQVAPDALANKLRAQREAAEKLAEQRVLAARQRAEAAMVTPAVQNTPNMNAKPKFSFADEDAKIARPAPAPQPAARPAQAQGQRPMNAAPPQQPNFSPQIAPPRPQLGGAVPPPRVQPQQAYPQGQPSPQGYSQNYMPQSPPAYVPPPAYRPIDPATGYAQPSGFNPQPRGGFAPTPSQQQMPPRLQVPLRAPQPEYGYEDQGGRGNNRFNNPGALRPPVQTPVYGDQDGDDIFEKPAPARMQRRATANEYQQAYREEESEYEDDAPRSRVPWIMAMLLGLVLVGFGSFWAYANYFKPMVMGNVSQTVPVVKAPDTPTKVVPDATVDAKPAATPDQAVTPTKKQIYDRIVGDREVLGGQIVPTEVAPVQPDSNAATKPAAAPDAIAAPATPGTSNDGTPLPLPPPPGDTTTSPQGSLEPSGKGNQELATITPAAGASPAADSSPPIPAAPVPGELAKKIVTSTVDAPSQVASATTIVDDAKPAAGETIKDAQDNTDGATIVDKKVKILAQKKPVAMKNEKALGSKPVILVPPAKKIAGVKIVDTTETVVASSGGLYGDTAIGNAAAQNVPAVEAPVQKRRTLLDLFKKDTAADTVVASATPVSPAPVLPVRKPIAVAPAPVPQQIASSGAYVAQLASFKSKAEATAEYSRMRSKHGAIVSRYAPIISEGQVAGTTRYRLNIGPMASADVASGLCQSLISAGERDCLVHRQ